MAWVEEKTAALVARLGAGELEAALVALGPEVGDLEREVIAKDSFVLAVGYEHRLARSASPVALEDIRDSEVLLLDEGHCLREQALPLCESRRPRIQLPAPRACRPWFKWSPVGPASPCSAAWL